jgi:transcriptional regulator with XRE-family HTH domain
MTINEVRKKENLTVKQFESELGISHSLCEKVLYGGKKPSRALLQKVKSKYPYFDLNIFFTNELHQ